MARTLTICSYSLAALGVLITFYFDSSPFAIGLLPYLFFAFAARSARRPTTRAVVLILTVSSLCLGFWTFHDALVRPSTLNALPFDIVVVESFSAGATWLIVRRIERATRPHAEASQRSPDSQ